MTCKCFVRLTRQGDECEEKNRIPVDLQATSTRGEGRPSISWGTIKGGKGEEGGWSIYNSLAGVGLSQL